MIRNSKSYIFFSTPIVGVGGGQIYVRNKMKLLKQQGWDVFVFSCRWGNIYIEDLKEFSPCIMRYLEIEPQYFSYKYIEKKIKEISNIADGNYDEVVVESHNEVMALWAELLAKNLQAKHLVYLLAEDLIKDCSAEYMDFYLFKYDRHELVGIRPEAIYNLISKYRNIDKNNHCFLDAACINVVEEMDNSIIDSLTSKDINIGIIGRLEKPYVIPVAKELKIFALQHREKIIQVIFFGGTTSKFVSKRLENFFSDIENINVVITGYIYPIPKKIFKLMDIFVSSSGSAVVSWRENVPTIAIDVLDYKPIGVLGYDTTSALYREFEEEISVAALLEKILYGNYLTKFSYRHEEAFIENNVYIDHIQYVEKMNSGSCFFPVLDMKKRKTLRSILKSKMVNIVKKPILRFKLTDELKVLILELVGYDHYQDLKSIYKKFTG